MYDSVLFVVSDIHWGSWNIFPSNKGDLLIIVAATLVVCFFSSNTFQLGIALGKVRWAFKSRGIIQIIHFLVVKCLSVVSHKETYRYTRMSASVLRQQNITLLFGQCGFRSQVIEVSTFPLGFSAEAIIDYGLEAKWGYIDGWIFKDKF